MYTCIYIYTGFNPYLSLDTRSYTDKPLKEKTPTGYVFVYIFMYPCTYMYIYVYMYIYIYI